jgi:iron(III) transport system permease protein
MERSRISPSTRSRRAYIGPGFHWEIGPRLRNSPPALLVFVIGAVALERASRGAARSYGGRARQAGVAVRAVQLTGLRAAAATTLCVIPLLAGFVLPMLLLLRLLSFEADVALTSPFLCVGVQQLACARAGGRACRGAGDHRRVRDSPCAGRDHARRPAVVLILGYAVPGTVLAVGVLLPLSPVDNWLATTIRDRDRVTIRDCCLTERLSRSFTPISSVTSPCLERHRAGIRADHAVDGRRGAQPGAGAWGTLRRVHAPLLARSGAAALLLVFVDVMKELPATLVLRPFNFDTLATQTYLLAKDERLAEAALPSLAIVAVGLVPIILLARIGAKPRVEGSLAIRPEEVSAKSFGRPRAFRVVTATKRVDS